MSNRVEHPSYYQLKNGIEIIDIIRYYTCDIANAMKYISRAGLKGEQGLTLREKEIEDCNKALWYLRDYLRNGIRLSRKTVFTLPAHPCGVDCEDIASCYCEEIAMAFRLLWYVGLIVNGVLIRPRCEMTMVLKAIRSIESHVEALSQG